MESGTTYLVTAITAIATEYLRKEFQSSFDIRVELLCWIVLYLGLILRRAAWKSPAADLEDGLLSQKVESNFTWMAWSTSFCIALARLLMVYYGTSLAMPLTVVCTSLALSYRDSKLAILPKTGFSTRSSRSIFQFPYSFQLPTLGLLALSSLFLFLDISNGSSVLVLVLFLSARSSSFVLLDMYKEHSQQLSHPKMLEAIVLRVSVILVGALLVIPPSPMLAWPMILQALCTSVGLTGTTYLVLGGHTFVATTIDSYSTSAIQSFLPGTVHKSLIMPLISITSLALGVTSLPPSTTRRKIFALAIIPFLSILTGNSALLHTGSFQSAVGRITPMGLGSSVHPIQQLAEKANRKYNTMINTQSQTLEACCAEYERRYGRKPPPHFDTWFQVAQEQGFLLVDEFDSMMATMEPLWGVAPSDIRARVENVIEASQGQGMYRLTVSEGSFTNIGNWMSSVFGTWFKPNVLETLPNMTLAMNTMDEPKVVVPHDMLSHAMKTARNRRKDTPSPGKNPDLAQHVDFLSIGKQNTWDALSVSCAPDTMARDFSLEARKSPYLTEMGFLSNVTLSKDVCQFPELHNIHAGLRHPDSMTLTHALVPVFSQAKATCFNDLLYPSPFYVEKMRMEEYKEKEDTEWEEKKNIVYWTGSNTGGRSTHENWRSLQRQRLALMTLDKNRPINLLNRVQKFGGLSSEWVSINSTIASISNNTRVRISAAIQCEEDACAEQNEELQIQTGERDEISAGYEARYNLDIDGNGLSGRFYRLLMSKSAVLKQTLYQEWHDDWLIPWVHYVPLSMDLRDFPEIVRYLTQEPEGEALGQKVAQNSYEWSRRVLRSEDMKLVWWRLMLEYGRLFNDDRDEMYYRV